MLWPGSRRCQGCPGRTGGRHGTQCRLHEQPCLLNIALLGSVTVRAIFQADQVLVWLGYVLGGAAHLLF
jgi:hypothetical protein